MLSLSNSLSSESTKNVKKWLAKILKREPEPEYLESFIIEEEEKLNIDESVVKSLSKLGYPSEYVVKCLE